MIHISFSMFLDRPGVMRRVDKKIQRVLAQTGAYARVAMQRQIRPAKRGKKARTILVGRQLLLVPIYGKVVDAKTKRPVSKPLADAARRAMGQRLRSEGAGRPPRRGPTDLLRKHIYFGVEPNSETVVIGPMKFHRQPSLVGASSVPELLEKGGGEIVGGVLTKYEPHPFVQSTLPAAERKFRELIERVPL